MRRLLFGMVAVMALVAAACADNGVVDTLAEAREAGVINAGFATEPPFGFSEDGRVTGQSPEVARAIFAELGVDDINGVSAEFAGLIPGLQAGQFDMVAAGMFLNEERCEQALFSDPDYGAPQAFAVAAGNPLDLNSYEDVVDNSDARLGVLAGAVEEGYASDIGVPDDQVETFANDTDLIAALQADRVDAIALTSISIRDLVETADDPNVEMAEPFVPVIDGEEELGFGGYVFRWEDWELRDAFNEVLVQWKAEQTGLLEIVEPFGFSDVELTSAQDVTLGDLCPDAQERLENLRAGTEE
jgi:polar amino acid transport system substrate-binding protein